MVMAVLVLGLVDGRLLIVACSQMVAKFNAAAVAAAPRFVSRTRLELRRPPPLSIVIVANNNRKPTIGVVSIVSGAIGDYERCCCSLDLDDRRSDGAINES